ncbi:MAG: glycerol-3-phosphate dehydrogenase (NAD(P)+) [Alteromonas naphthalenivorans]|jgi:glycerol-3-phosphate dehydrogenase (NAD(P)+)
MKVTILGSGAWGTAIATVLAHNHHEVTLWTHEQDVVQTINEQHVNTHYLPDVLLHHAISATTNKEQALHQADWVFEAIPVKYMRSVLEQFVPYYTQEQQWVVLSKGIEQNTKLLPSQILDDVFSSSVQSVVLAGPSFAKDVVAQQLTAVSIASKHSILLNNLKELMTTDYFKLSPTEDVIGVQLCAALKNVITFGIGMLNGLMCTDNTKAFFFVQSLKEMRQLVIACGGQASTVEGYAGVGDLILTAFGLHSRNLIAGKAFIDKTEQPNQRVVPESLNTIVSVNQLIEEKNLHLVLLKSIYSVVAKDKEPSYILQQLAH